MRYCGRDGAISEAKSAIADFSEAGSEATAAEAAEMIVKQNCKQFCLFIFLKKIISNPSSID